MWLCLFFFFFFFFWVSGTMPAYLAVSTVDKMCYLGVPATLPTGTYPETLDARCFPARLRNFSEVQ
jgi:hypothetical protein